MDDFSIDPFWIDASSAGIAGVVGEDFSYRDGGGGGGGNSFCLPLYDSTATNSFRNDIASVAAVSEEIRNNPYNDGLTTSPGLCSELDVGGGVPYQTLAQHTGNEQQKPQEKICFTTDSAVVSVQANAPVQVASSSATNLWNDISNVTTTAKHLQNLEKNDDVNENTDTKIIRDNHLPPFTTTMFPMSCPIIMTSSFFPATASNINTMNFPNNTYQANPFIVGHAAMPASTYLNPFSRGSSSTIVIPTPQNEPLHYTTTNNFIMPSTMPVDDSDLRVKRHQAKEAETLSENKQQFRDRNEREQMRAKRIAELITTLYNFIHDSGWMVDQKKSKCHTLSQAKSYIQHLLQNIQEKKDHVKSLQNLLIEKQKQQKPSILLDYKTLFMTSNIPQVIASISRILTC